MASKIRAVGLGIIFLIIIASFVTMSVIQGNTVGDVKKSGIAKCTSSSVELNWKRISSADGYVIYKKAKGETSYSEAARVNNSRAQEYTVEELEQGTPYQFYICAYKQTKKKLILSENYDLLSTCTKPQQQSITTLTSTDEGAVDIQWEMNNNAAGYQLQYIKGDGAAFTQAQSETITSITNTSKKITKLNPKSTYSFRVRSYSKFNKKNVFGAWSEIKSVTVADKVEMPSDIDPKKPMVALTFDDGPGYNDASDRILDVLEKYNARASFFMVGVNAKDHPKNLKRKVELGCEIGNHTYNHNHYGKNVTAQDIKKASDAIYKACGKYPTVFRSPGGITTSTIRNECKAENMALYYWSLDTQDWKSRNADKVYNSVMKYVEDGDIILMHEIYGSTADAVERLVPKLIEEGYQLVTVSELVQAKTGKPPVAGQQYVTADKIKNKTS